MFTPITIQFSQEHLGFWEGAFDSVQRLIHRVSLQLYFRSSQIGLALSQHMDDMLFSLLHCWYFVCVTVCDECWNSDTSRCFLFVLHNGVSLWLPKKSLAQHTHGCLCLAAFLFFFYYDCLISTFNKFSYCRTLYRTSSKNLLIV